jgi:putative endonuclease
MSYKQSFGKWGEKTAADYLVSKGLLIVEQNWRCSFGEIDIVAKKDNTWTFVEVKTRKNDQYGFPEEAITHKKRTHLINSAVFYIDDHQIKEEWRIDIVSVRRMFNQEIEIEWFHDAIKENG